MKAILDEIEIGGNINTEKVIEFNKALCRCISKMFNDWFTDSVVADRST